MLRADGAGAAPARLRPPSSRSPIHARSFRQLGRRALPASCCRPRWRSPPATPPRSAPRPTTSAAWRCSPPATPTGRWSSSATSSGSNGEHIAARLAYAGVAARARRDPRGAIGQYLRAGRAGPDRTSRPPRAGAELALQVQDFATAAEQRAEAYALAPADPDPRAEGDRRLPRTARPAPRRWRWPRGVVAEDPGIVPAQMVLIADRLAAGAPAEALALIDAALAHAPGDEGLHLVRLATLEALGDTAGSRRRAAAHGRALPRRTRGVRQALVQWHLAQRRPRRRRGGAARAPPARDAATTRGRR